MTTQPTSAASISYNTASRISTSPEVRPAVNANWQARRELAAALRRLNSASLTADVPTGLLQSATAEVLEQVARFEAQKRLFGNQVQTGHIAAKRPPEASAAIQAPSGTV